MCLWWGQIGVIFYENTAIEIKVASKFGISIHKFFLELKFLLDSVIIQLSRPNTNIVDINVYFWLIIISTNILSKLKIEFNYFKI